MPVRGPGPGISGLALVLVGAGGLLIISGLKNATVSDTLRALLKGQPIPSKASALDAARLEVQAIGEAPPAQAAGEAPPAPTGATDLGDRIVAAARQQIGKPYAWATAGPDRFDCSGLVSYVLKQVGVTDKRMVTGQFYVWTGAVTVPRPPRPGDLICYTGHIGIATGPTTMIHAPTFGETVKESPIWWTPTPLVRRVKGA